MINKETIRDCFSLLESEYGKQSNQKKELWGQKLRKYTDKELIEAVGEFIDKGKFFPRISDIKEIIEGTPEEEAELAWLEFINKIDNEGSYFSVSFPKFPAIGAVIEALGGWIRISDMKFEEEKWVKKDFIKLYSIMKKRGDYPDELTGRFEIENSNKGYTEKSMLERYGRKLDGRKVDRKLIEEIKKHKKYEGKKEPIMIGDIIKTMKPKVASQNYPEGEE